jgi:protocatechuate 3,4-dioxygenase beta subunit
MERRMTRKQALGAAGSAGALYLAAGSGLPAALGRLAAAPPAAAATETAVVVTPSMTEGPYWIDEMLRRFDVRSNTSSASSSAGRAQAGVPLTVKINVHDASSGGAINGAHVDIWHANAYGLYSDESGQGGPGGGGSSTAGQNFLRGYQITGVDAGAGSAPVDGQASFLTIWPGWYQGRAIHIQVRVRTCDGGSVATNYTTQIFFSDADNDAVLSGAAPYDTRTPKTDSTADENDNVLTSSAVATNVVPVTGSIASGFAATFNIGLIGVESNVSATASDKAVSASLVSAKVTKAKNGNRSLVFSIKAGEALTAHASLVRGGRALGKATGHLAAGTHTLRVAIPASAASGTATAKVALADAAGNGKTLSARAHVPV